MKPSLIAVLLVASAAIGPAGPPPENWWLAKLDGTCTKIEQFGFRDPLEMARNHRFALLGPILSDVAVFGSENGETLIFRRGLSLCQAAANVLAHPPGFKARPETWYTEDTKSRTCTTVAQAYDFLGGPQDPDELQTALAQLGIIYGVTKNDQYGVILQSLHSTFPILLFRNLATCSTLLNEIIRQRQAI